MPAAGLGQELSVEVAPAPAVARAQVDADCHARTVADGAAVIARHGGDPDVVGGRVAACFTAFHSRKYKPERAENIAFSGVLTGG